MKQKKFKTLSKVTTLKNSSSNVLFCVSFELKIWMTLVNVLKIWIIIIAYGIKCMGYKKITENVQEKQCIEAIQFPKIMEWDDIPQRRI